MELPENIDKRVRELLNISENTLPMQRSLEHGLEIECLKRNMTRTEFHNVGMVIDHYGAQGYEVEEHMNRVADMYPRWKEHYDRKPVIDITQQAIYRHMLR